MLNNDELISVIFYLAGGRIRGSTRLQKIVFLVKRVLDIEGFRFEPWKYGPWSYELEEFLKELEVRGMLKIHVENPDLTYEFFGESPAKIYEAAQDLIRRGEEVFKELVRSDPVKAMYVKKVVRAAVSVSLSYLVAYIYSNYPEMTMKSTIHEKVKKWRETYGLRA
uniref:DUF4065 domain-containing protein n=1 Tax=Ignisphaera aggregans TaxID=334771 RepID=A0A7J3YU11_9CREN